MIIKMADELKTYDCLCGKCGIGYQSQDVNDTDNEGKCPPCKEKSKAIAENVQKIINQKRANRPPPLPPSTELPKMQGTDYINVRQLM